jgi:hypothetical protein
LLRSLFTASRKHEKYLDNPNWRQDEYYPCLKCSLKKDYTGEPCLFAHHSCKHFDEWKYFKKTEKEKCKIDLKYASKLLDDCWGHHQDGSDLMVNTSELFDIVFNKVIRLIDKTNERL